MLLSMLARVELPAWHLCLAHLQHYPFASRRVLSWEPACTDASPLKSQNSSELWSDDRNHSFLPPTAGAKMTAGRTEVESLLSHAALSTVTVKRIQMYTDFYM